MTLVETFQSKKGDTFLERESLEKKVIELQHELDTLDDRFVYGKINDEFLYNKLRT